MLETQNEYWDESKNEYVIDNRSKDVISNEKLAIKKKWYSQLLTHQIVIKH